MEKLQAWFSHPSNARWIRLLITVLAVIGMAMLYWDSASAVRIIIDGEAEVRRTHARTVSSALVDWGIDVSPFDQVFPPPDSPLSDQIRLEHARPVAIQADGEWHHVNTAETYPLNILQEVGLEVFPGDRLWADGLLLHDNTDQLSHTPARITVQRGYRIRLQTEDGTVILHSAAPTVGEALLEAGYTLHDADYLSPAPETPLSGAMSVEYQPARPILIEVDGQDVQTYAVGPTVGEALAQAGIALVGLDYSQPDVQEPLPEDGHLVVFRVREEVKLELEPVPFEVEYQAVSDLELDQLQVIDNGTYGVMARRVRVRYENGEEIDQEVENAVVIVDPEPRVLGYGTQIVVRTLSTADGVIEYWRAVEVYATAYSPCNLGVPWCGYTTASGAELKRGIVGVIRSWFNVMQGMRVYVPGYGYGSIEDIGGGIAGRHWIDLGFTDENLEPWHNWTTIYFLTPVPSPDRILYILP
jgi:uncharacterized protein YabE (DUF348 family)